MIISASRRTDIPALYPEWFMNRLVGGEVLVPNPYNRKKVSRIELSPETVDCFVFWTKNPEPMLPYLKMIDRLASLIILKDNYRLWQRSGAESSDYGREYGYISFC